MGIVEDFCEMVRIPSESGNEAEFLGWLRERFQERTGANCRFDNYGNLICKLPGKRTREAEAILLCAHADTVRPGTGVEPVVEGDVIRSRGDTILGADDKAGIAAILHGILGARHHPPLEVVITREEEVGLLGAKNLDVSLLESRIGFVLDGEALDEIIIGGPSHFLIDVEITGRSAHAGMEPEKGISAITAAARAIVRLPQGRLDHATTANVGTIQGGSVRNAVPERVRIQAECRSLEHPRAVEVAELYQRIFREEAEAMGAAAEVKVELAYRASRVPEDSPAVRLAAAAIASLGLEPKPRLICGGTDASILNQKGITAVVLGMGAREAHTAREHIRIRDLEAAASLVRALLENATSL